MIDNMNVTLYQTTFQVWACAISSLFFVMQNISLFGRERKLDFFLQSDFFHRVH